jgi:hypothetical protein
MARQSNSWMTTIPTSFSLLSTSSRGKATCSMPVPLVSRRRGRKSGTICMGSVLRMSTQCGRCRTPPTLEVRSSYSLFFNALILCSGGLSPRTRSRGNRGSSSLPPSGPSHSSPPGPPRCDYLDFSLFLNLTLPNRRCYPLSDRPCPSEVEEAQIDEECNANCNGRLLCPGCAESIKNHNKTLTY